MNNTQQQTIFGNDVQTTVEIETTGRIIRPWIRMLDSVAGEHKLQFHNDGITVQTVDSGNVHMVDVDIHASAFDHYNINAPGTYGVQTTVLSSVCRHARYGKRTDDEIRLEITGDNHISSMVEREYDGTNVKYQEKSALTDPASIRESPDVPEFDAVAVAQPSTDGFIRSLKAMTGDRPVHLTQADHGLTLEEHTDVDESRVKVECPTRGDGETSLYSGDYIQDVANALENGLVEYITVDWSEEFPVRVSFDRPGVYTGKFVIAPRIRSD